MTSPESEAASGSPLPVPTPGERYHHLDAVRAFALLLGVVFHAAESFGPDNYYWAVVDCSATWFTEWVRHACHAFRMELFFIIAGFFARFLLLRRGTGGFVRNRLSRILVPLVVGWCVLYPVLVFIWLWGASVSGRLASVGVPPEAANYPLWGLTLGFFMTGEFVRKFDLTHLWFLHQLLVVYALLLGARFLVLRLAPLHNMVTKGDSWFAFLLGKRWMLIGFMIPTVPILFLMKDWGVDTPKQSLIPEAGPTLLYAFCFFTGWMWHRQPVLLRQVARSWWKHLAIGVIIWVLFGIWKEHAKYDRMTPGELRWAHLVYLVFYAGMMWGFALGFLGLFTRFFQTTNRWVRYFADASYWIYLAHLPLVVALQVAVARIPQPWPLKLGFITAVALFILLVSYHYLVRGTWVGVMLNGKRQARVWPWQPQR